MVGCNLAILHQNTPKGIDPEASSSSGNAQGIEYGGMPPVSSVGFDIKTNLLKIEYYENRLKILLASFCCNGHFFRFVYEIL